MLFDHVNTASSLTESHVEEDLEGFEEENEVYWDEIFAGGDDNIDSGFVIRRKVDLCGNGRQLYSHCGSTRVQFTGYQVVEREDLEKVTMYSLNVIQHNKEWNIFHRFSGFHQLNTMLKEIYPHAKLVLPEKRWSGRFDANFIEQRFIGLQNYVEKLLKTDFLFKCDEVQNFLKLKNPPNSATQTRDSPEELIDVLREEISALKRSIAEKDDQIAKLLHDKPSSSKPHSNEIHVDVETAQEA